MHCFESDLDLIVKIVVTYNSIMLYIPAINKLCEFNRITLSVFMGKLSKWLN